MKNKKLFLFLFVYSFVMNTNLLANEGGRKESLTIVPFAGLTPVDPAAVGFVSVVANVKPLSNQDSLDIPGARTERLAQRYDQYKASWRGWFNGLVKSLMGGDLPFFIDDEEVFIPVEKQEHYLGTFESPKSVELTTSGDIKNLKKVPSQIFERAASVLNLFSSGQQPRQEDENNNCDNLKRVGSLDSGLNDTIN